MTDKTQPEALRLAEMLTADEWPGSVTIVSYARECVAELRRQHARIAELEAALFAYASEFEPNGDGDPDVGSIHANIRAMKAKLASIGAGGVQALSAAPAGWKLVPVEPTVDQEWAGKNAALRCSTMGEACKIYKAMLAASPTPPAEQTFITPETGNSVSAKGAAITSESGTPPAHTRRTPGTPPAEQQAQPGAVGRTGCTAGTDEECTQRGCATSCPAAPKAAPARRVGTIAHIGNGSTTLTAAIASVLAAPQQEAQEPALFVSAKQLADLFDPSHATGGSYLPARKTRAGLFTQPLYSAPQPAPAPLSDDVVRDAARYRWLRDKNSHYLHNRAWLASVTAVKDGPCDIFSADEVAALLDAEIDRRSVAARKQGANHD